MNLEINHFKNKLSDYMYLKYKLRDLKEEKLVLDTKRGIHAIRYDKVTVQSSPDPHQQELQRIADEEKNAYLESKLKEYTNRLNEINDFLNASKIGESIKKIHCTGESTYEKEAAILYVGVRSLKRQVNRDISNYLIEKERMALGDRGK